jgi:hypothetical protein
MSLVLVLGIVGVPDNALGTTGPVSGSLVLGLCHRSAVGERSATPGAARMRVEGGDVPSSALPRPAPFMVHLWVDSESGLGGAGDSPRCPRQRRDFAPPVVVASLRDADVSPIVRSFLAYQLSFRSYPKPLIISAK